MSLHDCHGRQKFNQYPKSITNDAEFKCSWPACNCPLSSVSGAFHNEKIEYIISQKAKNPNFKYRIKI